MSTVVPRPYYYKHCTDVSKPSAALHRMHRRTLRAEVSEVERCLSQAVAVSRTARSVAVFRL